ncbi:MAG: hypothetical protein QW594_02910 [Candidatus Woesearchaeota archaeon]
MTAIAAIGYSLTGHCCFILYEKRKFKRFAVFGIMLSIVGFLYVMVQNWWDFVEYGLREIYLIFALFMLLAASTAHASLLLLIEPKNKIGQISLSTTLALISILVFIIIRAYLNWGDDNWDYRLVWVCAILVILGTFITPLLNKMYSLEPEKNTS